MGYLAQDAHIFTTTIGENVRIGNRDATDADAAVALERAGLHLPVDGSWARPAHSCPAARLDGWHWRGCWSAFQVLILDEPTEHLDVLTATALMDDIWQTTSDAAVLVITHDPTVIARCDRVVSLAS